ncbi:hypothetical protein [uncultured Mediterranean phage]|nr:hypothetical protein [uncultured Mediterranean phage]
MMKLLLKLYTSYSSSPGDYIVDYTHIPETVKQLPGINLNQKNL